MEFWNIFAQESLQKPWLIGSEAQASGSVEPSNQKVFLVPPGTSTELYLMVSKMIAALKYPPTEVSVVEMGAEKFDESGDWVKSKKILFFGDLDGAPLGEFINIHGHKLIRTHSLSSLAENVELKKQTWNHLKKYASLR